MTHGHLPPGEHADLIERLEEHDGINAIIDNFGAGPIHYATDDMRKAAAALRLSGGGVGHESSPAYVSGQWRALNDVLAYLNTLDTKVVDKTEVYKAVGAMRPQDFRTGTTARALASALSAMSIAASIPAVSAEYDFTGAIEEVRAVWNGSALTPSDATVAELRKKVEELTAELTKIAAALGESADPFAAWETLEVVLSALRFYADRRAYEELSAEEAEERFGKGELHSMIDRACLSSGNGRLRVETVNGRVVPPILSDWGKRARTALGDRK